MEQFLKTKKGLINLRMVDKIEITSRDPWLLIQLDRRTSNLPAIELSYDQDIKRQHDVRLIIQGIRHGDSLIELEYE